MIARVVPKLAGLGSQCETSNWLESNFKKWVNKVMNLKYLLLACLAFASCQSAQQISSLRKPQTAPRTQFITEPSTKNHNEVTIAFVGDVIIHERIRTREEKVNEGFQSIWSNIQSYLDQADITYANLEGPVAPEYGGVTGFPMFNFPEEIIPSLKDGGFDIVSTANNHALDRQARGIRKTNENLKKYQLLHAGTINNSMNIESGIETWWTLTPIPSSSKSIAWIACTEMTNGNPDKENLVLYCFKDREKIKGLIQSLKEKDDVAAIILTPHWGEEEKFDIEPHIKTWGRTMLDLGASAIVGSHPHVIRRVEEYTTKDSRKTLVAYSMGNFVSNQPWIPNKTSMILYLKFKAEPSQKLLNLINVKFVPLWTTRVIEKDNTSKFRIQPVWNFTTVPAEAVQIWKNQVGDERRIKSEIELKQFLN